MAAGRSHWRVALGIVLLPALLLATACATGQQAGPSGSLTIWTLTTNHVAALQQAATAWNKKNNGNVKVTVQFIDQTNGLYKSKIDAAVISHTLPDLFAYYGGAGTWNLAGAGAYRDLTPNVDQQWLSEFNPTIVSGTIEYSQQLADACTQNPDCTTKNLKVGSIFGFPQIAGETGYIFANKQLLQAAGIDPSKSPSTWEDWITMLKATTAKDPQKGGLVLGVKDVGSVGWIYNPLSFFMMGSAAWQARNQPGGDWTTPASLATLNAFNELAPYFLPGTLNLGINDADATFARGGAAFDFGGTYTYGGIVAAGMDATNIVTYTLPVPPGSAIAKPSWKPWTSTTIGISRDTKNFDLALSFLKFYESPAGGAIFANAAHDIPAVTVPATSIDPALRALESSFGSTADSFDEIAPIGPQCQAGSSFFGQISVLTTKLITQEATPTQVAAQLQSTFTRDWKACGK